MAARLCEHQMVARSPLLQADGALEVVLALGPSSMRLGIRVSTEFRQTGGRVRRCTVVTADSKPKLLVVVVVVRHGAQQTGMGLMEVLLLTLHIDTHSQSVRQTELLITFCLTNV